MKILVNRNYFSKDATCGELYIDGVKFCDTLEDTYRQLPPTCPNTPRGVNCTCNEKVYGKTCIPCETFKVTYRYSNKFGKHYPAIENVPHFLGILIHAGATVEHSEGCILVGNRVKGKEQLCNQFDISSRLSNIIKKEIEGSGIVEIEICNVK